MVIIGIKELNYFSKKQNKQIVGTIYFIAEEAKNGLGYYPIGQWFDSHGSNLSLNEEVNVFYNRFGNISKVERAGW